MLVLVKEARITEAGSHMVVNARSFVVDNFSVIEQARIKEIIAKLKTKLVIERATFIRCSTIKILDVIVEENFVMEPTIADTQVNHMIQCHMER